jgi:two-component system, response regulator YesN
LRIVIVDDESVICDGLSKMLDAQKEPSWKLVGVYNDAEEALETCDWDSVDLLLADISMPGVDGLQMVEALRDRGWENSVIIISGYAQFEYARRAMLNKAVDYVIKPVSPDRLLGALRKADEILRERLAERNSRIFILNNMDRLTREFIGEIIFETHILTEAEKERNMVSLGLEGKTFVVLVLLSSGKGEAAALLEAARQGQRATQYCYPNGAGVFTVVAVCEEAGDFDSRLFRDAAQRVFAAVLWCQSVPVASLDALTAAHAGLLEQLRDSRSFDQAQRQWDKDAGLPPISSDYSSPVVRAIGIIREDYSKPLSLSILADKVFIHPTYLSNLFKKQTGYVIIDYINHYRIEKAKELLQDPLNKIYWVTEQVGFANQRYFSQVFKKITGLTPVEYRSSFFLHQEKR